MTIAIATADEGTPTSTTRHDDRRSAAAGRLRATLEGETGTRLAYKRAKARKFVTLARASRKISLAQLRAELAADPGLQALENAWERARIDLIVEQALNWGGLKLTTAGADAEPEDGGNS
jgi:hypothetical protein